MRTIYIALLNIIILTVLFPLDSFTQTGKFTIEGTIIDASNNKPVEFANIGIEGTFLGTASDIDGKFSLEIGSEYSDNYAVISAVGYQTKKLKVSELTGKSVVVKMTPAVYGLSEVDITARSMILYGIIRSASNLITQNYVSGPLNYSLFFEKEKEDSVLTQAVISLFDNKGYGDRNYTGAFINRSYKVDEIRRAPELKPVREGGTDIDDILLFDIVRVRGNILDSAGLYDFKLKQEDITIYDGDSVWVISYSNDKPDFVTAGNRNVTSYSGVIYISKTTSAVLRNEMTIETDGYFPYGYTAFYNDEIREKDVKSAKYEVVTSYRKDTEGKYILSSINIEKELNRTDGKKVTMGENIKVLRSGTADKPFSEGREYYSLKQENKKFWERFTIPE